MTERYEPGDLTPEAARELIPHLHQLIDELDEAANIEVRTISGEVLDAEYSEGLRYAATRIRDVLTDADKEADQ